MALAVTSTSKDKVNVTAFDLFDVAKEFEYRHISTVQVTALTRLYQRYGTTLNKLYGSI